MLRLEALERVSRGKLPSQENSNALLGSVKRPTVTLSQALEIYCNQIAVGELLGKSDSQKKAWKKVKLRAVNYFIDLHGDLSIDEITREHARAFYNWWAERVSPTDGRKPLSANSANRDIGNLRKLYREYWEFEGEEDRENPFRKLTFGKHGIKDIPHFEDEWVRTRLLNLDVLKGINPEAVKLLYAMIETGCRPTLQEFGCHTEISMAALASLLLRSV